MNLLSEVTQLVKLGGSQNIARRYFVVNGFDGAIAMLGLNMGFHASEGVTTDTALSACIGTAIALCVSGVSSGYVSESAEQQRTLRELEQAMVADMRESVHATAARLVPAFIALVNGFAPLLVAMVIITPFWLARADMI